MGSLCSKHDRDDNEPAPRPARAVSVAEVGAHTTEMLERRATQRAAETVTVPVTVSVDPPPAVAPVQPPPVAIPLQTLPKTRESIRLSRMQADLISDGLMTGSVDFANVSKTVGSRQVIVEEGADDAGPARRATNRRSHGEVSRSPTSSRTTNPLFGPRPEPWKSPEAKAEVAAGSGESASATPEQKPEVQSPARSPSIDRPYQELPSSPTQQASGVKRRHVSSSLRIPDVQEPVRNPTAVRQPSAVRKPQPVKTTTSTRRPNRQFLRSTVLSGHEGAVFSVAFSKDGKQLVSGSEDKSVRIWDMSTKKLQKTIKLHIDAVRSVAVSPKDNTLASASLDQTIRLWELPDPDFPSKTFLTHANLILDANIMSVAFSQDGRRLASGVGDNVVRVWDLESGDIAHELSGHDTSVASVAFSPDGRYLASGSLDMTIRIWDPEGKLVETLEDHIGCVHAVAFSPCNSRLASASSDKTVILWDTLPGKPITKHLCLRDHTDFVWSVAFTPDGERLASGSADKTIRTWQVATGQILYVLRGHQDAVLSVAFSPLGNRIASASRDKTVRVWEVEEDS